jgi:hypothetical protein
VLVADNRLSGPAVQAGGGGLEQWGQGRVAELAFVFEAAAGLLGSQAQLIKLLVDGAVAVGSFQGVWGGAAEVGRVQAVAGGLAHEARLSYPAAEVNGAVAGNACNVEALPA